MFPRYQVSGEEIPPSPRPPASALGASVPAHGPGGAASEGDPEGRLRRSCYSPAQVGGAQRGQQGRRGLGGQLGWRGGLGRELSHSGPRLLSSVSGATL